MKPHMFLMFLSLISSSFLPAANSQVEFIAPLAGVGQNDAGETILRMQLTPDFVVPVRVSGATEIKGINNLEIGVPELVVDSSLKVEAVFTDLGLLALEVEVTETVDEFELRGEIQSIQGRTVRVLDFPVVVPVGAEVKDEFGGPLPFSALSVGQAVKVEGSAVGTDLVARQVRRLASGDGFAQINVEGVVVAIEGAIVTLEIDGGVRTLVEIDHQTNIEGTLAVGVRAKVIGEMNAGLFVTALRIDVKSGLELIPDEVHMTVGQIRTIDILLDSPESEDVLVELVSRNPAIAIPHQDIVLIEARRLTASFEVQSVGEGDTFIDVVAPIGLGASRSLKVEVDDLPELPDLPDVPVQELVEVKWSPRDVQVEFAQPETLVAQLVLNRPAPEDLILNLFVKEGSPAGVSFPDTALIPAGERTTSVTVEILGVTDRVKIRAQLPANVGLDTDDLEIEVREAVQEDLELSWSPDKLEVRIGETVSVRLMLDSPTPFSFDTIVTLKDGDPSLVFGMPSTIHFGAGQQSVQLKLGTGEGRGEVKFRAALPFELGGDHDDLEIEIDD